MDNYVQFDEIIDVLESLKQFDTSLGLLPEEPHQWKWAVLALHSAVSGAMVCELSGTANLGALRKDSAKELLAFISDELSTTVKESKLATADVLFKRLIGQQERIERKGSELTFDRSVYEAFELLHNHRNQFTHFSPKSWSIEVSGYPSVFRKNLSIVQEVGRSGWGFRHLNEINSTVLDELFKSIDGSLKRLEVILARSIV